jgi:predicted RNase H-like HicB family nuclease
MTETRYAIVLEPEPDGSAWNVVVPAFPEIATFGRTREHALEMAADAIALSIEYRREKGFEVPPPGAH